MALGDHVELIEHGGIARDVAVPAARTRRHGHVALATIEGEILAWLLRR